MRFSPLACGPSDPLILTWPCINKLAGYRIPFPRPFLIEYITCSLIGRPLVPTSLKVSMSNSSAEMHGNAPMPAYTDRDKIDAAAHVDTSSSVKQRKRYQLGNTAT